MQRIIYHAIGGQSLLSVLHAHYTILINIHRFFSHLVDILGPEDFLAPVCMLLIDKVVNRIIRQSVEEVQMSLALPISILQHYPSTMQIFVRLFIILLAGISDATSQILTELLREGQRLAGRVTDPEQITPTFLDFPR
jgi:U3 small nucleolar RNA-associated protein 10